MAIPLLQIIVPFSFLLKFPGAIFFPLRDNSWICTELQKWELIWEFGGSITLFIHLAETNFCGGEVKGPCVYHKFGEKLKKSKKNVFLPKSKIHTNTDRTF